MSRRRWVRLDNASNIFLAARSDVDPKVFRLGAEMDHVVDPDLLQAALEETFARFPLYHAVLRRGVFWYYLQDSDLEPRVEAERLPACAPLYEPDRRTLLFRVVHHRRRISLEVFHALSDGTGALWFLTDLLAAYARRRFPDEPASRIPPPAVPALGEEGVHELTTDSFAHYFRRRRRARMPATHWEEFRAQAAPAVLSVPAEAVHEHPAESAARTEPTAPTEPTEPPSRRPIHRLRGTRTPDHRTRAVELSMPAAEVIALAKAERVTPSMFLTAVLFEAIRRTDPAAHRSSTLSASVPVNLRQFFPSTSARNFFATTRVEHTFASGADSLSDIAADLQRQFGHEAAPEQLERRLKKLFQVERTPAARIVPRPVKDLILRLINLANNRSLTVAISNLGRVTLPAPAEAHVGRMQFQVSAARPQFCAISHAGQLAITFTSPFLETAHVREFARQLTEIGIPVTVAAPPASEAEFALSHGGRAGG